MTTRRALTFATATAFGLGLTAASLLAPPTVAVAEDVVGVATDAVDTATKAIETSIEADAGADVLAASQAIESDVTLDQAHVAITAAAIRAAEIDTKMDIAVVDAGGNLKAFIRMDGAWLGSIDIAITKAKTARLFDMNTGDIGGLSQPGGPLYGIEHSNNGLITFPGGIPLKNAAGDVIGAIGVSGSSVENDHDVASAGADAI
ncbi:MAG: heme-binding protein [Algisphaera sp.]